jgi:hypothetical protein
MAWRVFNHNHTTLGVFDIREEAVEESEFYTYVTGNASGVEEVTSDDWICPECDTCRLGFQVACHRCSDG